MHVGGPNRPSRRGWAAREEPIQNNYNTRELIDGNMLIHPARPPTSNYCRHNNAELRYRIEYVAVGGPTTVIDGRATYCLH